MSAGFRRPVFLGWLVAVAVLLLVEAGLRCAGLPAGTYRGVFAQGALGAGLWDAGFRGVLRSGPIPYRVAANADGFRGAPLRPASDPAAARICAIGDSMTDGYYVDNEATYPHQLARALRERGHDVEVINAARGAGSIDRFGAILRELVLPLEPDVVLVTFVSNDLGELGRYPLVRSSSERWEEARGVVPFIATRTAIGESLMSLVLRLTATSGERGTQELLGEERYRILGGTDFSTNARVFENRFVEGADRGDGLVLAPELSPIGLRAFELYVTLLREFRDACRAADVDVLLLYVPAYSELYAPEGEERRTPGKDLLMGELAELGIPTLDLTHALRKGSGLDGGGARTALHLAPVDFHLNPSGNRVVAAAVADALVEHDLLPPAEAALRR